MQDLQHLRKILLSTEDVVELYTMELDLTEFINTQHQAMMLAQSSMEQSEIKSKLSLANALLGICKERQAEVKDLNGRANYNFRMAAKLMLHKSTYEAIVSQAQRSRKDVKDQAEQLRKNKLQ